MKKTLKSFIIFSIVFVLLFPNVSVVAAGIANEVDITNTINTRYLSSSTPKGIEKKGNIEVYINLRLPVDDPSFTITVQKEGGAKISPNSNSTIVNSNTVYYLFPGLDAGTYTLEINGDNYVPYKQSGIVLENETITLNITNAHDGDNVVKSKVGVIAYGDVNNDKIVDTQDEEAMIAQIESHEYNENFDLNNDNKVNIIDLSYISLNNSDKVGKENVEAFPIKSINIEDIKVEKPENVQYSGELESILKNNDEFVSFRPTSGEISGDNPIFIELDLSASNQETGGIVIAPSPYPENNIKGGTIFVEVEEAGERSVIPYNIGGNNLFSMFEFKLASNAGIMPMNVNFAKIEKDGSITIDLHGKVAIKKVTIKVTETGSNKLADIAKVEFLNDMNDRIPAPDLDIPVNLSATAGSKEFTVTWDKAKNVTGYEVSISSNGVNEIRKVDSNTLTVSSFQNKEIKNGTKFEVRVQSINGEWKSGFCAPITVTPKATTLPPKPENLEVFTGYRYLTASWKMMDDTDSYDVYYKLASEDDSQYRLAVEKLVASTYTIRELEDDTEYTIKVVGRNDIGSGDFAWANQKTASVLNHPKLPEMNLINTSKGDSQLTNHIVDAWYGTAGENRQMVNSPLDDGRTLEKDSEFTYGKFSALGLVDNNYASYFTVSQWHAGAANYDKNRGMIFKFDEKLKVSYITFADYQYVGSYSEACVYYKDDAGKWNTVRNVRISEKKDSEGKTYQFIKLVEPIETDCIGFGVAGWGGRTVITVSEVRFYGYDSIEKEVDDLFGDDLHITLKPGIQMENIEAVETKLKTPDEATQELHPDKDALQAEINLAKDILNNNVKRETIEIDSKVSTKYDSNITFLGGLNPGQPLGVVAHKGDEVIVYVGNPAKRNGESTDLELVLTQYHGTAASWYQSLGTLKVGKNVFTINGVDGFDDDSKFPGEKAEKGGSLYINYNGSNPSDNYAVRVLGGHDIPVLDLTKVAKDESSRKTAIKAYIQELEEYVNNSKDGKLHKEICNADTEKDSAIKSSQFDEVNCILGATEIVLDQMMYSVSSEMIYKGLTGSSIDDKVNQLYDSLVAMEDMVDLFYSHKGLYKIDGQLTLADNARNINRYPTTRLNTRYQRMFYGAFMYAGGKHIGIEWGSVSGLSGGKPIESTDGKYKDGQYFGWGIAHEIGHIINEGAYSVAEVTNNYFSVLAQAKETNESVRFLYENVYDKVTSGVKGRASNVFTQLGMYWQLHLAYDTGYNYKMYSSQKEQFDNLFFARVDTYARELAAGRKTTAPGSSDNTLTLEGADKDNVIMRLACAAAEKNLLDFFERWGMIPDEETIEYASQFKEEERPIYYITDESRLYTLESGEHMAAGTTVSATLDYTKNTNQVTLHLNNTDKTNAILGYEIVRSYMDNDKEISRAVAFVTVNEDNPSEEVVYTDTISTINNRVFTYSVKAVDKYLDVTDTYVLNPVKISHDGSIDKSNWTIETNLVSKADTTEDATKDSELPCEAETTKAISKIMDKNYESDKYVGKVEDSEKTPGEIIISLGETEQIAALKYTGEALGNCEIQISEDAMHWVTVNDCEISGDTVLYFDLDNRNDGKLYFYDVAYVKIIIEDASSDVTISEIDLIGETGDNVELLENGIGILKDDYHYDDTDETEFIPAGSLIFTGTYKGNPAYNVIKLWDENDKIIEGSQIILADKPAEGTLLGDVAEGIWIYWITPEQLEERGISVADIKYELGVFFDEEDFDEDLDLENMFDEDSYKNVVDDDPSFDDELDSSDTVNEEMTQQTLPNDEDLFDETVQNQESEESGDEVLEADSYDYNKVSNDETYGIAKISATNVSGAPISVRAELYRVNDAHTMDGERLVSDTYRVTLPTELKDITIQK